MVIDFDGREVTFGFGELDEVVLAYRQVNVLPTFHQLQSDTRRA